MVENKCNFCHKLGTPDQRNSINNIIYHQYGSNVDTIGRTKTMPRSDSGYFFCRIFLSASCSEAHTSRDYFFFSIFVWTFMNCGLVG